MKEARDRYQLAMQTIGRNFNKIIKDIVNTEIKNELYLTLQFIVRKGQTTNTELAKYFEVGKSTITARLTQLGQLELIEKYSNQKDKRTIYVAATNKGQELDRKIEHKILIVLSKIIEDVEETELVNFLHTLEKFAYLLEEKS